MQVASSHSNCNGRRKVWRIGKFLRNERSSKYIDTSYCSTKIGKYLNFPCLGKALTENVRETKKHKKCATKYLLLLKMWIVSDCLYLQENFANEIQLCIVPNKTMYSTQTYYVCIDPKMGLVSNLTIQHFIFTHFPSI